MCGRSCSYYDAAVLDGVGSVRWEDPAVADWLVRLVDAVEDDRDEIDDDYSPTLLCDGVVGPDAAAAVPFLIRL